MMSNCLHIHSFYSKNTSKKIIKDECANVVMKANTEKLQMALTKSFWRKDRDLLLENYEESFFPDRSMPVAAQGKGKPAICY